MNPRCARGIRWLAVVLLVEGAVGTAAQTAIDTGNGRLAVALDDRGWLSRFRWPGPGGRDQSGVRQIDGSWSGAGWFWYESGEWRTFDPDHWSVRQDYTAPDSLVVVSHFEERNGSRAAVQRVFVPPDTGVLVAQLQLYGFAPDLPVCWYQNFSPSVAPGLPRNAIPAPVPAQVDFATWFDEDTDSVTHFRPETPGQEDWARARAITANNPPSKGWDTFGKGVCIATASPNEIQSVWIARKEVAFNSAPSELPAEAIRSCVGPAHAALLLAPDPQQEARLLTVVIGAGPEPSAATFSVVEARQRGVADLLQAAEAAGAQWLKGARHLPAQPDIPRSVLDLLLCIDRSTGAIVENPVAAGDWSCAAVFTTAWSTAALASLGYSDAVERALDVHLGTVRDGSAFGLPAGSLPATIFVSGRAAGLAGAADPDAAAWLLAACWRYAAQLPEPAATAYLTPRWPDLARAVDFLAREPQAGQILASGTPVEGASLHQLETHYLGLESARRISLALSLPETGLAGDRRVELYARIRLGRLNGPGRPRPEPDWVARWAEGLSHAEEDAGWEVLRYPPAALTMDWEERLPADARALRKALHCLAAAEKEGGHREPIDTNEGAAP